MKVTTHKTITRFALELCREKLDLQMCKNSQFIIKGSEDEDEHTIERIKNWHFYRQDTSPIPEKVKMLWLKDCLPTSEIIIQKRIDDMYAADKFGQEYCYQLGRVLHHIQDMSTPSHVTPIYHGFFKKDYLEGFMEKNDSRITANSITIPTSIDGISKLYDIYDNAANEMLDILSGTFDVHNGCKESKKLPYSLFWKNYKEKEDEKINGFGVYGKYHKYFKETKALKNNKFGITKETLLSIQDTVINQAVINSCKALLYLNSDEPSLIPMN